MTLQILFWILFILCCVGGFTPYGLPAPSRPYGVVILILIGILGFKVFGGIH